MNLYLHVLKLQSFGSAFVILVSVFAFRSVLVAGGFLLIKRLCSTARYNAVIVRAQKALSWSERLVPALTSISLDAFFSLAMIRLGVLNVSFENGAAAIVTGIALMF